MNVGIPVVADGPMPPICLGSGSVVRQKTRRMIE
jgi:hypothetical protein